MSRRTGSGETVRRRVVWFCAVLGVAFVGVERGGSSTPFVTEQERADGVLGPASAHAVVDRSHDYDVDGLPDGIEALLGTEPLIHDSDGDGFSDGIEWVCRADPLNPLEVPRLSPSMRCIAYEVSGRVKLFASIFPADPSTLDSFSAFLGNENLASMGQNQIIGIVNITGLLTTAVREVTSQRVMGTNLAGFFLDFPFSVVDQFSPLSVGISAKVAGRPLVEEVTLLKRNGRRMVLINEAPAAAGGTGVVLSLLPLDPHGNASGGGGTQDPEYCQTNLGSGDPTGLGGIQFVVESSACLPDGLLYCVAEDCADLQGETFVMIDYGFLQARAQ